MATQSASLVKILDYKLYSPTSAITAFQPKQQTLSLVKDSYSGKYYGSGSYDSVVSSIKQARSYFTDIISKADGGGLGWDGLGVRTAPVNMSIGSAMGGLSPYEEAKRGLSSLEGFTLDSSQYVQKPQMLESFNAHPDGWNKYFESSYKAPKIAEENATLTNRNSQSQGGNNGKATSNQLLSNNLGIRKEVGTGVGKSSIGLNPFGQLDAGLNI